jgi:hypothetical protein
LNIEGVPGCELQAVRAEGRLQHDGYERLDGQLITQHTGRAENPLVFKSVQLGCWSGLTQ